MLKFADECFIARVVNSLKTERTSGFDIFNAVVDEQRGVRRVSDRPDSVMIDTLIRLGDPEPVGKGVMRKSSEPGAALGDAIFHGVTHV